MEIKLVVICLKILLLIYSFVFWLTGVILLAIGVLGKLTLDIYISLIARNSINAPSVFIGMGTTIIIFGLYGCFAICRGNPWMLKLYSLILLLVFLAELAATISGLVFHHKIKERILKIYTSAVQNYNGTNEQSQAVDQVQSILTCCGVRNYTDWNTSSYFLVHGIPHSCCKDETDCNFEDLLNLTAAATKINQRGCYDLMMNFLEASTWIIIVMLFAVTFLQLIGMKLNCCLSRFISVHQDEIEKKSFARRVE